eukprot:COSAG06_NODE_49309_length_326_cov_0.898678_1_plen_69_part_10
MSEGSPLTDARARRVEARDSLERKLSAEEIVNSLRHRATVEKRGRAHAVRRLYRLPAGHSCCNHKGMNL